MNKEQLICSRCKQGYVEPVLIKSLENRAAWICIECEAFWEKDPSIDIGVYTTFSEFMSARGLIDDLLTLEFLRDC